MYSLHTAAPECVLPSPLPLPPTPPPCPPPAPPYHNPHTPSTTLKPNKLALLLCCHARSYVSQHDELDGEVSAVMSKVAAAERRGLSGTAALYSRTHTCLICIHPHNSFATHVGCFQYACWLWSEHPVQSMCTLLHAISYSLFPFYLSACTSWEQSTPESGLLSTLSPLGALSP